uniref:Uncharacterized protein n=1 Tax=Meloidogyne hapla TaxID=6305 RepID=A0A1I8B871_MELHA
MEQWDTWLAEDIFDNKKIKNEDITKNKIIKISSSSNTSNNVEINKSDETTPLWSPKISVKNKELYSTSKSDLNAFVQLIERKEPLNEILKIKNLSDELKKEAIIWNEKYPDLTIFGKGIKKSLEQQERENLRKIISKRIIEDHLMPEVYASLNKNKLLNKNSKSGRQSFLPPINNSSQKRKEVNKMIKQKNNK